MYVASSDGKATYVDGLPLGNWVRSELQGETIYCDYTVPGEHLAAMVTRSGDYCMGSPFGDTTGASLKTDGKAIKLLYTDVWGVDDAGRNAAELLAGIADECNAGGIDFRPTAAATVGGILKARIPSLVGLRPRWREISHGAIHAGPITHCVGSAPDVTHIDRRKAFLDALYVHLPPVTGAYWVAMRGGEMPLYGDGFALARVRVEEDYQIAPMPIRHKDRTYAPLGEFWGIWPIPWLSWAVESGWCDVVDIKYSIRCGGGDKWLAPIADSIQRLPKIVAKPLYTRIWGLMCSRGKWRGIPQEFAGESIGVCADGMCWVWKGRKYTDKGCPPLYRPDVSAYICADNYLKVMSTVYALEPWSVAAAHVDTLWTSDHSGAESVLFDGVGGWRKEGRGDFRMWSPGVYRHNADGRNVYGCAGWQERKRAPTPKEVRDFGRTGEPPQTRAWDGNPRLDREAASAPGAVPFDYDSPGLRHSVFDKNVWSPGGYYRPSFDREEE